MNNYDIAFIPKIARILFILSFILIIEQLDQIDIKFLTHRSHRYYFSWAYVKLKVPFSSKDPFSRCPLVCGHYFKDY